MIVIYGLLVLAGIGLMVHSRGQPGVFIYKKGLILARRLSGHPFKSNALVVSDFQTLYPFERSQEKVADYYRKKIHLVFLIILAGAVVAFLLTLNGRLDDRIRDGAFLQRATYGGGESQITITPVWESASSALGEYSEPVEIQVGERRYTQDQLEQLYNEMLDKLSQIIPGENETLSHVDKPLVLPTAIPGYPYKISWEISDYRLLGEDGSIGANVSPEGEVVNLIANFTYFGEKRSYELAAVIFPKELTAKERLREHMLQQIHEKDLETQYEEVFALPTSILGEKVTWMEEREDYSAMLFIMFILAAVVIFYAKDRELHQEIERRQQELLCDYPGILSKLTLYIGAGLTVRGSIKKIVREYQTKLKDSKKHRYAYEELCFASYEMDNGVSEAMAFDHFGRRCRQASYSKLASLLSQNSKKGNSSLLIQLQNESDKAQEERRNLARKLGEEAGTKLLFPMLLLLIMVMLMILIPAMLSFTF